MTKRNRALKKAGPFLAGVLIGLSVVTPVFGATLDADALQPLVLLGSFVVLLVGLVLKAAVMGKTSGRATKRDGRAAFPADMRWRQTDLAADIALPGHSLR